MGSALAIDALGWAGAVVMLHAYGLLTRNPDAATGRVYLALNLAGSGALAVNGAAHAAWPSAVLNLLWLAIGVSGLVTRVRRSRSPRCGSACPPDRVAALG